MKKSGLTYYCQGLIPDAGREYYLEVNYNNLNAHARTFIPGTPEIKSFHYRFIEIADSWYDWKLEYYVKIKPLPGSAYTGVTIRDYGNGQKISYSSWEAAKVSDTSADGLLNVIFWEDYTDDTTHLPDFKNYSLGILAYDSDFYDYFRTRYNSDMNWDLFGSSGTNVLWNIKGDGIGMFLGKNIVESEINM